MIQTQQNTFVLFTLFKLTLDERKTLTKISMHKPLTIIPQTSTCLGHDKIRKKKTSKLQRNGKVHCAQSSGRKWVKSILHTHDVLPPSLHLDCDPDSKTRGVDDIAPVLTPSLLSGLVGNIRGLKKSEIPTQPIPFEAGDGVGTHGWIPPKMEAPGPSHKVGVIPQTLASMGEVSKHEPLDQGTSQHDPLMFEVNPEEVAEVIVSDDDDLDLTLEEPQVISTPANEPAPHRKRCADDQDPPSSPSSKWQPERKACAHHTRRKPCLKG